MNWTDKVRIPSTLLLLLRHDVEFNRIWPKCWWKMVRNYVCGGWREEEEH